MARTSRNGAKAEAAAVGPPPSVDALDNIDIDGFMDGGDGLFDDFDMDLDKMGDIVNNFEDKKNDDTALDLSVDDPILSNESSSTPAPAPAPVAPPIKEQEKVAPTTRRRKTKRKTKLPVFLAEDEAEDVAQEDITVSTSTTTTKKRRKGKKRVGRAKKDTQPVQTPTAGDNSSQSTTATLLSQQTTNFSSSKNKGSKLSRGTTIVMPPPLSRPPSSGASTHGSVAMAGALGGRQKRGHFSLPMARQSDKTKSKLKAPGSSGRATGTSMSGIESESTLPISQPNKIKGRHANAPLGPTSSVSATPLPPINEIASSFSSSKPLVSAAASSQSPLSIPSQSLFCGLHPSNTKFYPFMPSLPSELSIKNRKIYPVIERVNSSFMSFLSPVSKIMNGVDTAVVAEPIYRLMLETLPEISNIPPVPPSSSGGSSGGACSAEEKAAENKRLAVASGIGSLRRMVTQLDRPNFTNDLFSICALLKRQHDFITTNLSNMDHWCKDNFSDADFSTYVKEDGGTGRGKKKVGASLLSSIVMKTGKPIVRIKVRFSGFRESPKLVGSLFAMLPISITMGAVGTGAPHHSAPASSVVNSNQQQSNKPTKNPDKKRKLSIAPDTAASAVSTNKSSKMTSLSYVEGPPSKRRMYISDLVCKTAEDLESMHVQRVEGFSQALDKRQNGMRKIVEDDDIVVIHTAAMWQYIEQSGYFADFSEDTVKHFLRSVWSPEIRHPEEIRPSDPSYDDKVNLPNRYSDLAWDNESSVRKEQVLSTGMSLFDRLQSLLIEEFSDDSEDKEENDSLLHDELEEEPYSELSVENVLHADLSDLTINERTFLHLRSAGLIEDNQNNLSSVTWGRQGLNIKQDMPNTNTLKVENDQLESENCDNGDSGLNDVIDAMVSDLISLNKLSNARAAFLDSVTKFHFVKMRQARKRREEEKTLLAKCQDIFKKNANREGKTRNLKQKVGSSGSSTILKDEYALPW